MNIIDAHVHLYNKPDIKKEMNVSKEDVNGLLGGLSKKTEQNGIERALVYILDDRVLSMNLSIPDNLIISVIAGDNLNKTVNKGIRIIKILPYEQEITRDKYSDVLDIAEFAQDNKMILAICATYGSRLIYDTNGVELASYIKRRFDIPIILAHGGGPKIIEAMSLALDYEDIFLDLSFSLKYWRGSSVIDDYAFAIRKLKAKKIFYGSDYPYLGFNESTRCFMEFIDKYSFREQDKENMLYNNFINFERRYL